MVTDHKVPLSNTKKKQVNLVVSSLLLVVFLQGSLAAATNGNNNAGHPGNSAKKHPKLFSLPATASQSKADKGKVADNASVVRKRSVKVNTSLLKGLKRQGGMLHFDLFEDVSFNAYFDYVIERGPNSFTWFGDLIGDSFGTFSLAFEDDVVIANLRVPGKGLYQIKYLADGLHEIRQIDPSKLMPCGGAISPQNSQPNAFYPQAESPLTIEQSAAATDDGTEIDVIIVYTTEVLNDAGGQVPMTATVNLLIDESNLAYLQSQIQTRLRLVYHSVVAYTESNDAETDLARLRKTSDGHMDQIHSWRNTYGADLVSLIAKQGFLEPCGVGYLLPSLSSSYNIYGFSWVADNCLADFTFAHELGHNMGCHHAVGDSGTARGDGLYNYSHGWRWTGDSGTQFRSIMAYSPGTVVQHFSNPNIYFDGQPTGRVNLEDNSRTINNSSYTVASYRQHTVNHTPPQAQNEVVYFDPQVSTAATISLTATDDDHPFPSLLTYIITSLPPDSILEDPATGLISAVPYVLANNGNEVVFNSSAGFTCMETFTFMANDGAVPPEGGDSANATITVKRGKILYSADMETNPGWILKRQWQWGSPTGQGSYNHDPVLGYTGANVMGYNLDGDYGSRLKSAQYATTPVIDCAGFEGVKLSFYRWLGVDSSVFDQANIEISADGNNWIEIWHNPDYAVTDTAWKYQEFDISTVADNQPTVYIRWGIAPTSQYIEYPGWNIDDIVVSGAELFQSLPGDFEPDCDVDMYDFSQLSASWQSTSSDPDWNSLYDISTPPDNVVDIEDLIVFAQNWLSEFVL